MNQPIGEEDVPALELHPSILAVLKMFDYDHITNEEVASVSADFQELAWKLVYKVPNGPNVTEGLRKLWEAKNLFVYQKVHG